MHVGIVGPIATESVASLLDLDALAEAPAGYLGAPLMGTLIRALINKGHRVSAYTHSRDLWEAGRGPVTLSAESRFRLTVVPLRPHSFRNNGPAPGRILDVFNKERLALCQAIERDSPDVIHGHWTYEFALAALDSHRPHVITAHDSPLHVLRYSKNLYRLARYFVARRVYRRAQYLTAVSPYTKAQVQRYTKVPITVIGNPVPDHAIPPTSSRKSRADAPTSPRVAMLLNGWSRRKNGEAGLLAFSLLRRRLPGATLHCFGADYGPGEAAETWATKHGVCAGVEFNGPTSHEEVLRRLGEADLLLHPALEESCPLSLIEAMALGIPVVGGDRSGGVPWVLDGGRSGVLTDVSSPEAMCRSMVGLLNDGVYEGVVQAAQARVDACFAPSAVAAQYESVYEDALRGWQQRN